MERDTSNRVDYLLWTCVILLVIVGLIMNLSASYISSEYKYGSGYFFFKKHLVYSVVGFLLMTFLSFVNYRIFKKFVSLAFILSFLSLVLVLAIGHGSHGAKRWLGVGPLNFQPVELAKYAIVLFLANYYTKHKDDLGSFVKGIIVPSAFIVPMLLLILKQPNYSAIMLLSAAIFFIMFTAGVKFLHLLYIAASAIPLLVIVLLSGKYRADRVQTFLDPFKDVSGDGYQVVQSFLAFYSGGFFGRGLGGSIQKLNYLPEAHNDFIFSIIVEENGFIGAVIVVGLFFFLIYRGMRIAIKSKDDFAKLLAFGITAIIACQAIVNFFVVTGLAPATGVPLPFVSYGGTALIIFMGSVGVLLNISRSVEK